MTRLDADLARRLLLDAAEQLPRDPEARGDDPAGIAGVDSFPENLDAQSPHHDPPERRGTPELVVVPAPRIEADHEARGSDPVGERLDVGGEIVAATLLARLDQHDRARPGDLLIGQDGQGGERGKSGIPIVRPPAAVETGASQNRCPWPETGLPPRHLRLFVEVAVEEDRLFARTRDLDEDQGGSSGETHDLEVHSGERMVVAPPRDEVYGSLHFAPGGPFLVEMGGFVRDFDILHEGGNDRVVPHPIDEGLRACSVHPPLPATRFRVPPRLGGGSTRLTGFSPPAPSLGILWIARMSRGEYITGSVGGQIA